MKPGFFHDVKLLKLSPLHRLLFEGLWCYSDREGRMVDDADQIKHDVLPADDCDIDAMLTDLCPIFIKRYQTGRKSYIQVRKFAKHQNPHKKENPSIIPPAPPDEFDEEEEKPDARPVQTEIIPGPTGLIPDSLNLIPDSGFPQPAIADVPAAPQEETPEDKSGLVDFQTFLWRWKDQPKTKKPAKGELDYLEAQWEAEVTITEWQLAEALKAFVASGTFNTAKSAIKLFISDPLKWLPRDAQPPGDIKTAPKGQVMPTDAPQPAQIKIDYPARWNELVPSKPVQWDWKRSAFDALRLAELDDVFVERFDEICRVAQAIHERCGPEADWITFEFAIRRSDKGCGWWRILTEFRDMRPRGPKSPESGQDEDGPWTEDRKVRKGKYFAADMAKLLAYENVRAEAEG